ncbi:MAG TPA: TetR/AcrR family transcriptional regulator [Burkholderiales bacterium]|nr:TetR/AcrR family transcriptional regulator [Burkholderiales bacterium]
MSAKAKAAGLPGTQPLPGEKERACDRIFNAACELFYRKGIRAVGIEAIAEKAHATKMSLYRTFPSKDELVAQYLQRESDRAFQRWDERLGAYSGDPRRQLSALFSELACSGEDRNSRGCALANAAVELTDPEHPGRKIIEEHKAELRSRLLRLCADAGARDPAALADGLFLLMEGAFSSARTLGSSGPGNALAQAAQALIEAQLPKAPAGT